MGDYQWPKLPAGVCEGDVMRVDRESLNSVIFICKDRKVDGEIHSIPVATGFLVSVPHPTEGHQGRRSVYVVTSQHVVIKSKEEIENPTGNVDVLRVRVNTPAGTVDVDTARDAWHCHETYDIAAIQFRGMPDEMVSTQIPISICLNKDYTFGKHPDQPPDFHVSTGDDVYIVGLFAQESGGLQNLPVARFGAISRMPSEFLAPKWRNDKSRNYCYLVECMSWGGLSGSPVFWAYPTKVVWPAVPRFLVKGRQVSVPFEGYMRRLLGIVTGHIHGTRDENPQLLGEEWGSIVKRLNSGIAVVVPAHALRELLDSEDIQQERREHSVLVDTLRSCFENQFFMDASRRDMRLIIAM